MRLGFGLTKIWCTPEVFSLRSFDNESSVEPSKGGVMLDSALSELMLPVNRRWANPTRCAIVSGEWNNTSPAQPPFESCLTAEKSNRLFPGTECEKYTKSL